MTVQKGGWDYFNVNFIIWTGAGTTNAPTQSVPMGAIGVNSDGASTGDVYVFDAANATWRDTTQSMAGFFGV